MPKYRVQLSTLERFAYLIVDADSEAHAQQLAREVSAHTLESLEWKPREHIIASEVEIGDATELKTWTFFIMDESRKGTTHVSSHSALTRGEAEQLAIAECSDDWGDYDESSLTVIGVIEGEPKIVEWNDN